MSKSVIQPTKQPTEHSNIQQMDYISTYFDSSAAEREQGMSKGQGRENSQRASNQQSRSRSRRQERERHQRGSDRDYARDGARNLDPGVGETKEASWSSVLPSEETVSKLASTTTEYFGFAVDYVSTAISSSAATENKSTANNVQDGPDYGAKYPDNDIGYARPGGGRYDNSSEGSGSSRRPSDTYRPRPRDRFKGDDGVEYVRVPKEVKYGSDYVPSASSSRRADISISQHRSNPAPSSSPRRERYRRPSDQSHQRQQEPPQLGARQSSPDPSRRPSAANHVESFGMDRLSLSASENKSTPSRAPIRPRRGSLGGGSSEDTPSNHEPDSNSSSTSRNRRGVQRQDERDMSPTHQSHSSSRWTAPPVGWGSSAAAQDPLSK